MDNTGKSVAFRGGGFAPQSRRWVGVLIFVALILFVEWGTRADWISSLSLPRPSDVLDTFQQLYDSGLLFKHLLPSLTRLFVGALIGASIGIAVGIMIGLFSYVRSGLVPLVAAIFPIPKIALLPLFVIWFGTKFWPFMVVYRAKNRAARCHARYFVGAADQPFDCDYLAGGSGNVRRGIWDRGIYP